MQRAVQDTEQAARDLDRSDVLPKAKLTPAQRVGEPEMLALEKSIIDSSADLRMQSDQQIAEANAIIRSSLNPTGAERLLAKTRETLQAARDHLRGLLEVRIRVAMRRADERIQRLGPEANREAANRAARDELEKARLAGNDQLTELSEAIPKRTRVDLAATRKAYADDLAKRNEASDPNDIPDFVKRLLGSPDGKQKGLFDQPQEIGTVLTFRGRLLDEIAAARTTGGLTREKKRLLNSLQAAIIDDDLKVLAGQVDDETRAAVDLWRGYAKDLNDRFTRGPVAALLGRTRDRGVKTAEGLTLEVSVGRGGPVGREEADALTAAMEFSGDLPAMQASIETYLKDSFRRKVVEGGRIVASKAKGWMRQFDDVLDRYPELKQDFEGAIQADNTAVLAERRLKGVAKGLDDPRVSRAAIFL